MPYFLRDKCVWKGTKDDPIEKIKCHESRKKALAHMAALYVHVEKDDTAEYAYESNEVMPSGPVNINVSGILNATIHGAFTNAADKLYGLGYMGKDERIRLSGAIGDSLGILSAVLDDMHMGTRYIDIGLAESLVLGNIYTYKEQDNDDLRDRWITVSTSETWDRQDEMWTKDAIDYDVAHAVRTDRYPELRLFHVRGFKLGICDHMQRIGKWAVDQGDWFKTPLAQAMKDIIDVNTGKWRVSKGFHPVQAAGLCPSCDSNLTVGLLNFRFGVRCPQCEQIAKVSELIRLKHLKSVTFDLTITDVPVVTNTAISAYSVQNKE